MDTSRAAFEKFVTEEAIKRNYQFMDNLLSKFGDDYSVTWVDMAWMGWQASRAAIEIELPEANAHLIWIQAGHAPDDYWDDVEVSRSKEDKCCDGSDRYEVYAKWQLEEVFTSHGIRIKGKTE